MTTDDDIEQLRAELALAKAFGNACYQRAFPTKSLPVVIPTSTANRTARDACGGRDPETPFRGMPVSCLDLETTGVDSTTDRVIEIAIVTSDGREWASIVNPGVPIPPVASAVHGIDDAMVASAPTFAEAWTQAEAAGVLEHHPLAYSDFDQQMIAAELVRGDRPFAAQAMIDTAWLDPLVVVRDVEKFAKGKKLVDACDRRGIAIEGAHRAVADARACLALWLKLLEEGSAPRNVTTLGGILRWTRDRRVAQEADFQAFITRQVNRATRERSA